MPPDPAAVPPPGDADARPPEAERALQMLRRQQEILAHGISHDLRAPLRAIAGYAQILVAGHGEGLDPRGRDYLDRICEAAARMEELIEGLLMLSHAARAPLRESEVDLSLLAEWSLAELQDAEPGRAAEIGVQPQLAAWGDERLLKQLFERLLHNAWKFSAERDRVRIEVRGERRGGRTVISIVDHGSGFDMRYADRMFEPFQRLHGPEQGGGHGLGLAVVQCIAERHEGRLWAESTPGSGSVFHVELPAPRSSA
ncbi:sensor histidine kinase [Luteimonas sp. SJ-92]|uniref:histidine kinase n=1 Tax=Luteimonas salinisoli TaxID=2752307 RepID=A0A853J8H1_9GAMM|nr:ATP-binding protein [Luteimonas salinisoli]NZA25018.1 sensor histidine kinase [Luteimonas salinisoli]